MMAYEDLVRSAQKESINRFVVGAVIIEKGKVLLLQRPKEDFRGGIYELPSGKVEREEKLDTALRREVEEETGLQIKEITTYIGHFDYVSGRGKKTRQFNFAVKVKDSSNIRLTEHDDYLWQGVDNIREVNLTESVRSIVVKCVIR